MANSNMRSTFVVKVSSANMPTSCWGKYVRVAVLEMTPDAPFPHMISDRAKGVLRIVRTWEKCNVGKTWRCAAERAEKEAHDLADRLTRKQNDKLNMIAREMHRTEGC